MFIRVKTTANSPRRSVQVVRSERIGRRVTQRIVRHMGIALDAAEEGKLRLMAQEFIDHKIADALSQDALFETDADALRAPPKAASKAGVAGAKRGRPARGTLATVTIPGTNQVTLDQIVEVARRVEGPHEVLGHLYDYLGFDRVLAQAGKAQTAPGTGSRAQDMLRDLVIARIMAPASKRDSARQIGLDYGKTHSVDSLYRLMDKVHERLDDLKRVVFEATASLTGGMVDLMLFDITTLYFESVEEDQLRAFGYSKDQKYHVTQVVLALATNEDGLPIGYELFAGNTAEVSTLLACMRSWQEKIAIGKVSFVADRALCSQANLAKLEAGAWPYVVAMPLRRSLKATEQAMLLAATQATPTLIGGGNRGGGGSEGSAGSDSSSRDDGDGGDLLWVRECDWQGRRLIVTYSAKRAHKDRKDRQAVVDRLQAKLGSASKSTSKSASAAKSKSPAKSNAKKLISNSGYLKYVEQADSGGVFVLNEDKLAADAQWDGLHAIVTNDRTSSAAALLTRYRRLWVIEDSFRVLKHSLAVRPIYHFKPERVAAHIGICFLAFAVLRHAQHRIALAQGAMSAQRIRLALDGVQASVLRHKTTGTDYRMPGAFSHDAGAIYRAFGLTRELNAAVLSK